MKRLSFRVLLTTILQPFALRQLHFSSIICLIKLKSLLPIGQFAKGRIGFCSSSTVDINNSNGHDLIRFLSLFSVFFFVSFTHRKPFIFSLHLLLVLCSLLFTFFFLYRFIFFSFLSFSSSPYANLIDFCFVYRSEKKEQL